MTAALAIAVSNEGPDTPHVWRGRDLAVAAEPVVASGHAPLDAELPGGGWPLGCLVEVLQHRAERHVWQLLLPALRLAQSSDREGPVVLVAPPCRPFLPSLQAQGFAAHRLLTIDAEAQASRLWATEQALRCADVPAVLAWLPKASAAELRRLHLTAQRHAALFFVLRPVGVQHESSPARVRVLIEDVAALRVRILKRRGPPLVQPLELPAHPARLQELLASRRQRIAPVTPPKGRSHVLDRTVAHA